MTSGAALSIILVNYNDRPHLGPCLESVRAASAGLAVEVILVDNMSTDGSVELVRDGFPWVRLIANDRNEGFARANNIGLGAAGGRFVLFLNTDTIVPPGSLSALVGRLERRPEAGAIGPALVRGGSGFQVSFGRGVGFLAELRQKIVLNPYYRVVLKRSGKVRSVGWLSGACLLARREAVEAAGRFDEGFFIYFEDLDLCRRIGELGLELLFDPSVRVVHWGGATTAPRKVSSRLHYRESQLRYYEKHSAGMSLFLLKAYLQLSLAGMRLFRVRTAEDRILLDRLRKRVSGRREVEKSWPGSRSSS